jgi:hypothetical protein
MAASHKERYIQKSRCRYYQWYYPRNKGIALAGESTFAAVVRPGMDLVEMQAGMIAVYVGTAGTLEHLGQSGCDAVQIDAVDFAVVAHCASAALEAGMAWQLVRSLNGVAETSTAMVCQLDLAL